MIRAYQKSDIDAVHAIVAYIENDSAWMTDPDEWRDEPIEVKA